jgi:hypothetical protein
MLARTKRQVCIRRDKADFVVAFQPDNVVIYRNHNPRALRKLCRQLRWEIIEDVAVEVHDLLLGSGTVTDEAFSTQT